MRPTDLNFRSPKEKTPDHRYPLVTFDGRRLDLSAEKGKGSFSQGKRFTQYDKDAKKTGFMVGPGSYEGSKAGIGRNKSKGGPIYKKFHGDRDVYNNGYYFCGNQMVFEPSFVMKSKSKSKINYKDFRVDISQVVRPDSIVNLYKQNLASKKSTHSTRPTSARSGYLSKNMYCD